MSNANSHSLSSPRCSRKTDVDVVEPLRGSSRSAPPGFGSWLDQHLELHDPVLRAQRERGSDSVSSAYPPRSLKCWNDRCIHYVYGFPTELDRSCHVRMHATHFTRDSELSAFSSSLSSSSSVLPSRPNASEPLGPSPLMHLPRPALSSRLPPLRIPTPSTERRDSLIAYAYSSRSAAPRSAIDADVEPLLPPLKRSRVDSLPRLESIGELRLFHDQRPCLRCRVTKKEVGYNSLSFWHFFFSVVSSLSFPPPSPSASSSASLAHLLACSLCFGVSFCRRLTCFFFFFH